MSEAEKLLILDRDGVINYDSAEYIKSPEEWRPLPGSLEAIAALGAAGYKIVVVSNQSGVGRGLLSEATLERIHAKMKAAIRQAGGEVAGVYYCPHRPDDGCHGRKPQTGLLERAAEELGDPLTGAALIGDKAADLELARRWGARPILVRTGYGEQTLAGDADPELAVFADLAEAAAALIAAAAQ